MPKRSEAKATEAPAVEETKQDTSAKAGATTKKLPLTERVKKFFDKIDPELNKNVHEMSEQVVQDSEKNKNNMVMVVFTDKSNKKAEGVVVEEANIKHIKTALFGYHLMTDDKPTGKVLDMSILPPDPNDEDSVHILCVQEL